MTAHKGNHSSTYYTMWKKNYDPKPTYTNRMFVFGVNSNLILLFFHFKYCFFFLSICSYFLFCFNNSIQFNSSSGLFLNPINTLFASIILLKKWSVGYLYILCACTRIHSLTHSDTFVFGCHSHLERRQNKQIHFTHESSAI